ncbi:MAG: aminoacyl-tRNA hydrolase [Pseudomonadota bacterium]
MLILMGQGNPGPKYSGNRHNLGFTIVDEIAAAYGFPAWREKFSAMVSEGWIEGNGSRTKVLLMKPLTFYNETGQAVSKALKFFKLEPEAVTVFHDEIDLAPGRVRVKQGGGHSGNNGIRSVSAHIGSDFRRVRVGVGHPGDKSKVMPYVLSDFPKSEEAWVTAFLDACIRSLPLLLADDDERFQTEVLRLAPAPKSDPKKAARGQG